MLIKRHGVKTLIPRAPCWLFTFQSSRLRAFAARKSVSRAGFNIVYVEKLLCAINWEQRESCEYFLRVPLIAISQKFQLEFFHSPVSILHSFPIPGNFFPNFSMYTYIITTIFLVSDALVFIYRR